MPLFSFYWINNKNISLDCFNEDFVNCQVHFPLFNTIKTYILIHIFFLFIVLLLLSKYLKLHECFRLNGEKNQIESIFLEKLFQIYDTSAEVRYFILVPGIYFKFVAII